MSKSVAEIEREVEEARGRIDRTVEALKDKMQPTELFDEATRIMGGTSNKVLTTAVEQLRENPLPIALIGLGLAWLALGQTRRVPTGAGRSYGAAGYYPTYEGYDEDVGLRARVKAGADAAKTRLAEAAEGAKDRLSQVQAQAADGLSDVRERASELAHEAQARAGEFAQTAQDKAGEYRRAAQAKAGEYSREAKRRFDDTLESEPLVIGAVGLAVGAAIGAALPSSTVERRYFGPARDKAAAKAKASFNEVRDVAERAYGQVRDELHRQTGPEGVGASLREKAEAVAEAGARSVREEFDRPAH